MLQLEDIAGVLADPPEVLIVGQGDPGKMQVAQSVAEALDRLDVRFVAAPTKTACDEFNRFTREGARVVAALHLTC